MKSILGSVLCLIVGIALIVYSLKCIHCKECAKSGTGDAFEISKQMYMAGPPVPKQENPRVVCSHPYRHIRHIKKSCLKS